MKAIIFAAGKGERMRPLTDHTPKPLLTINGKPLIDFHLEKLAQAGFNQVIINLAYKGEMIKSHCGNGSRYGVAIEYSDEGPEPLETGGALNLCLPWFQNQCFAMISADIFCHFDYANLAQRITDLANSDAQANLALVANPAHNPKGDFSLQKATLCLAQQHTYTYSGLGVAKPTFIDQFPLKRQRFPLREAIYFWLESGKVYGYLCDDFWSDVGTPARLEALQSH
ncbi:nucleotidyltransferase family protein [Simiduia curdlanivorans]|uniref:NDP-sugar synthase n=1 Tax=Simiduia curdlanivorans TaxID=1492769 RepID=A0ABV8V4E5_9GAMM|nr:nucleotidyltransferase family protein [Simiduia curdlanivorans]MDN3637248.1 nucleotidyltransferase family protein [Simiduia curdlanivorans]